MKFLTPRPLWEQPADNGAAKQDAAADAAATAATAGADTGAGDNSGDKGGGPSFLASADDPNLDAANKSAAPADWPEDWRDRLTGGDAEIGKTLARYNSPNEVAKALREAQKKIASGKTGAAPLDEPMPDPEKDPEGLKAWREARGIPEDPTGYTIPDTVKDMVTDEDKPLIASFTESMHGKGIPPAAAAAAMEWYFEQQHASAEAVANNDKAAVEALQDELRAEWGSDFRANAVLAKRAGEHIFGDIPWTEARLPDGRRLGDIPGMTRSLAKAARAEFGDVAFAGEEATNKTQSRKAEIEKIMREDFDRYDRDPAMRKELEEINAAEQRRNSRQR